MSEHKKPERPDDGTPNAGLKRRDLLLSGMVAALVLLNTGVTPSAQAQQAPSGKRPNILVIMGDDIGWNNLGSYHQGLMLNATPNLDKLASEGMRFTDSTDTTKPT